ncbi:hypothetical protein [Frondihabitans sp. VKM Ac-2883]|jgi:hypothetical protein|uniref:hypothetical protein n=1 Tax=Frondihabitans sp. VKM Ac-2883 TaxID=2783823 RepID=UPI00188BB05F|nr:hypothetical protein [Frondihabitans sp. VKM Ac-2883]MBF4576011.1 hypothetical protein [Frondihabitans sp. VKM Ac-2883]
MNRTKTTIAAAALGLSIVLTPVAAQAASTPASVSSQTQAQSAVRGYTTEVLGGKSQYSQVMVIIDLTRSARVVVTDKHGASEVYYGNQNTPVRFFAEIDGSDAVTYKVVTSDSNGQNATAPVSVRVDLAGVALDAPHDLTTYDEQRRFQAAGVQFPLRFEGLPGADVTLVFNGSTMHATADSDGISTFDVTFLRASNRLAVSQVLDGKTSVINSHGYTFK